MAFVIVNTEGLESLILFVSDLAEARAFYVAQKGSHAQLKHPTRGGHVTVPLHAGEVIGPGLLRSMSFSSTRGWLAHVTPERSIRRADGPLLGDR